MKLIKRYWVELTLLVFVLLTLGWICMINNIPQFKSQEEKVNIYYAETRHNGINYDIVEIEEE